MSPCILDAPAVERALCLFGRARLAADELLVLVDRPHVASLVTPAQVDEQSIQHSQQPAARVLERLHLVEPRVGPQANLLYEVLGIHLRARQPVGGPIQHLIMLLDQRRKSFPLRLTARVDGWLSHAATVLWPHGA